MIETKISKLIDVRKALPSRLATIQDNVQVHVRATDGCQNTNWVNFLKETIVSNYGEILTCIKQTMDDNRKIIEDSKTIYKHLADDKMSSSTNSGFHDQFARDIYGEHTEFVFQRFANKWLLLITQYGKLANLYTVKFDVCRDDAFTSAIHGPVDHPKFHVSVPVTMNCNFGADKDEVRSGIQFLINKSKLNRCPTEILIGLALKDTNGKILREIATILDEIIT